MHLATCRTAPPPPLRVADAMIRGPKLLGPASTVGQVREFFRDDHVHTALLVDRGQLLAVVERSDLTDALAENSPAASVGFLAGRVTRPDADLLAIRTIMVARGRRRLAVIDSDGLFLGLLCLKRSGLGFCSDADVHARAQERSAAAPRSPAEPARPHHDKERPCYES